MKSMKSPNVSVGSSFKNSPKLKTQKSNEIAVKSKFFNTFNFSEGPLKGLKSYEMTDFVYLALIRENIDEENVLISLSS